MIHIAIAYPLLAFLALFAACDLSTRRIPNALSFPAMVAGIVVNMALFGLPGALVGLAGLLTATAIFLPVFALGGIGGGDVKMMAAVGAFLGPELTLAAMVFGMVLGGVVMVVVLARRGVLVEKLRATAMMLWSAFSIRSLEPLRAPATEPGAIALPYSVPLALGTVAALRFGSVLGG